MTHGMSHLWAEQIPRICFGERIGRVDLSGDFEDDNMPFFMSLLNGEALGIDMLHSRCRSTNIGNVKDSLVVNVDWCWFVLWHSQLT